MSAVHVVIPAGIDDPALPSGGNVYDRRICRGLTELGWSVAEHPMPGAWPRADAVAHAALRRVIGEVPDGAVVLVDGLIASTAPEVLVPEADRLRLIVLVHMPLGEGQGHRFDGAVQGGPDPDETAGTRRREAEVLAAATAVITTSAWTRTWLLARYPLRSARIHVASPGVETAGLAPGTAAGGELLCVAAVLPAKGHDTLVAALATIDDLPWRCRCVGSLDRDPGFVDLVRRRARADGLGDRLRLVGPQVGTNLDTAYAAADALVLASRAETYGMVVTEALARGLPVIATAVGGLPEALGCGADGTRPGLLVPPDDPVALAAALRSWLVDAGLRRRLRSVAGERRGTLAGMVGDLGEDRDRAGRSGGMTPPPVTAPPARVTPEWLALREPADAAARAPDLAGMLLPLLPPGGPVVVHDLGSGSGSMGRWLAPRLPGQQHWILYDRDIALLARAAADPPRPVGGSAVSVETRRRDITRLGPGDLVGASVITASALLDMLTADELDRIVTVCVAAGCPALLTLSVIGRVDLEPADPLDELLADAFNAHQRRVTDGRHLLGPDAVGAAVDAFTRLGSEVVVRPSPWRLDVVHADLTAEWITGWVAAACEQHPELTDPAAGYLGRRLAEADAGRLRVTVHHHDLLARPR